MVLCTCCAYGTSIHVVLCGCCTCCVMDMRYYVCAWCSDGIIIRCVVIYICICIVLCCTTNVGVCVVLYCTPGIGVCVLASKGDDLQN